MQRPSDGVQKRQNPEKSMERLRVKGKRQVRHRVLLPNKQVFNLTIYQAIYHKGWRCDETPLIYWKALDYLSHLCHMKWSCCPRDSSQPAAARNKCLDTKKKAFLSSPRRKQQQLLKGNIRKLNTHHSSSSWWALMCSDLHKIDAVEWLLGTRLLSCTSKHLRSSMHPPSSEGPLRNHSVYSFTSSCQCCNVNIPTGIYRAVVVG